MKIQPVPQDKKNKMIGKGLICSCSQIDPKDDCAHRKSKRAHRTTMRRNM